MGSQSFLILGWITSPTPQVKWKWILFVYCCLKRERTPWGKMPGAIFLDPVTFAAISLKAGSGPESSDSSVSSQSMSGGKCYNRYSILCAKY